MEQIQQALITLLLFIIPVLGTFIVAFIRKKTEEVNNNLKNTDLRKYIELADSVIISAVTMIQQTYVDALKAEERFGENEQKIAFVMAKDKILKMLSAKSLEAINMISADASTYIQAKIESAIHYVK